MNEDNTPMGEEDVNAPADDSGAAVSDESSANASADHDPNAEGHDANTCEFC